MKTTTKKRVELAFPNIVIGDTEATQSTSSPFDIIDVTPCWWYGMRLMIKEVIDGNGKYIWWMMDKDIPPPVIGHHANSELINEQIRFLKKNHDFSLLHELIAANPNWCIVPIMGKMLKTNHRVLRIFIWWGSHYFSIGPLSTSKQIEIIRNEGLLEAMESPSRYGHEVKHRPYTGIDDLVTQMSILILEP